MSKYIDAELLKEEIGRRRIHLNKEAEKYQALNNGYSQNCYGARDALRDLENFIDSLQQEHLEVEIKKYIPRDQCPVPDLMEAVARHFYELGKNSK